MPDKQQQTKIPSGYDSKDTQDRLDWLNSKINFKYSSNLQNEPEDLKGIIENHIGFMNIPMAIAGPLDINGDYAQGEFHVPICTLEGTLALSMNRGMMAAQRSGGVTVKHIKQELSRAPVFIFENLNKSVSYTHLTLPTKA